MADTRGIRAGRAFVELGVSDKLSSGLKAAQKKLEAFGAGLRSIGTTMAGIGVAAVTALLGTAKVFSDSGDALDKMSALTGVSVEALSELSYAADLSGTDMETLENGLRVMQKTLVEASQGSKGANEDLARLGLTVQDLARLSPDEQFKLLADRISRIQDPAARAAMAMELFGKAGTKLLPLMSDGAAGINEMQEQARKLGLTVSTETTRDAAELNDALGTLWKVLKQGVFTIGGALAPTIKDLSERITRIVVSATAWVKANKETVVWTLKVAAAVAVAGIAIVGLGYIISGIGAALGIVAAVIGGIGTAFSLIGAAIGQDFENAQEALRKDTEAGLAESQAALDAAKQKLAAAIEEARKKREAADAEKGPGRSQRDLLADFEDRLSGLGAAIGKGISVTGTFSAAAVSGLGTGGDAAERTASATEQTARNTKRLLDASVDNGLRFA